MNPRSTPTNRRPTKRISRPLGLALPLTICAAAIAIAAGTSGGGSGTRAAFELRASGTTAISNSKEGSAILSASGLTPGKSTSGDVTITNTGDAAFYAVSESNVTGGALAGELQLTVQDLTGGNTVYSGPLSGMPTESLGGLGPGDARTYRFTVALPQSADNSFQSSTASVQFDWAATVPEPTGAGGGTGDTGGTGGDTGGSGAQTSAAKLVLRGALTQHSYKSVTFFATCNQFCQLVVGGTATVPTTSKVFRLSTYRKFLPAGLRTKITYRFSRKIQAAIRRALARRRVTTVSLKISTRNMAGIASKAATRRIKITPPRR